MSGGTASDAATDDFVGILSGASTIDPVSVAPKKANWDLKRDVQKRLDKLERATQSAIRELIRACGTCAYHDVRGIEASVACAGRKLAEEGKTEEEKGTTLQRRSRCS